MPTDDKENSRGAVFTDCLGTVSAIVEETKIESVYIMGDFNAHPGRPFYDELLSFCAEQNWSCVDIDKLGVDSDTITFVSDINGSKRWLDHCLTTYASVNSVIYVYVKADDLWSDHYPGM